MPAQDNADVTQVSEKASRRFDIWEFRVSGNTILDTQQIERAVYPYLGPGRTVEDVDAARVTLEALYRDAGYPTVLVDIPEQNVRDGVVKLVITEGTIDRVRVSGSKYYSPRRIRSQIPALKRGEILYLPDLQEQLAELNQASGDRNITPVMRPGRTPGTVEVELKVDDELPLHGGLELNNRRSPDTTQLRLVASLRYDNLWQKEHSASLFFQTAPENTDEVKVFSGTYVMRLPDSDKVLVLYGVDSQSDVATAGDLTVIGDGVIAGSRLVMPITPGERYFHSVSLGFDYKDFNESTELLGADDFKTPIHYLNLSAGYKGTLLTLRSESNFEIGANFGVRGLLDNTDEFELKRANAKPNYAYFTAGVQHTLRLENGVDIFGAVDGQLADSPLISNEQYSAGGVFSVRGYLESEALGDNGVRASVELRSPSLAGHLPDSIDSFRVLAFADGAKLYLEDTLPGQQGSFELLGSGLGMRIKAFSHLDATLDFAWALSDSDNTSRGDTTLHFKLGYEF